jgi:hypothetical protein
MAAWKQDLVRQSGGTAASFCNRFVTERGHASLKAVAPVRALPLPTYFQFQSNGDP